jgi:hypothetical protein
VKFPGSYFVLSETIEQGDVDQKCRSQQLDTYLLGELVILLNNL